MIEIPTIVYVLLVAFMVLLALSALLLVAVVADALVAQRRVRVARGASIGTHYFGLAHSH
ncbi:hypothetical protein [Nocardioides sp. W7]|uniref:hypothetical protein n=1 Tax=Nocardioides sp. W7 TaxID=2931390 RepID=UPI001FD1AEB1|nr:hypothetical protein [Nocardioides sp. W7]